MKLDVLLAIPSQYQSALDLNEVRKVFPYGHVRFEIQDGGMVAPSGIAIDSLGDRNDDMVVVCASDTVDSPLCILAIFPDIHRSSLIAPQQRYLRATHCQGYFVFHVASVRT